MPEEPKPPTFFEQEQAKCDFVEKCLRPAVDAWVARAEAALARRIIAESQRDPDA